jgi:hypothetical protein
MQKVTPENLEVIREQIPYDQAKELKPDCITGRLPDDGAHLTVWPDQKLGAISYGGDSHWFDYTGTSIDMLVQAINE